MQNLISQITTFKYFNELVLVVALILILGAWKFVIERE